MLNPFVFHPFCPHKVLVLYAINGVSTLRIWRALEIRDITSMSKHFAENIHQQYIYNSWGFQGQWPEIKLVNRLTIIFYHKFRWLRICPLKLCKHNEKLNIILFLKRFFLNLIYKQAKNWKQKYAFVIL